MGYRGKLAERQQARLLRSSGRPLAEIDRLLAEGRALIGRLSEREFLVAGGRPVRGGREQAVADPTIRHAKQVHGCVSIDYSCSPTHRSIMGLVAGLLW